MVAWKRERPGLPCVFSTGVTEEVLLRPDSCRISLEQPDEILGARQGCEWKCGHGLDPATSRRPCAGRRQQVRAAGYDIRQETLRLQQLYTGLIAKRGAAHA